MIRTKPFPLAAAVAATALAALVAGCGKPQPPVFRLDLVQMRELPDQQKQDVSTALTALFGTPDEPFAPEESGLDLTKLKRAAGPVSSDEHGRRQGLYREHCAYCHGISGDGAGPQAAVLNPYPRDYRRGLFKFKTTERPARPTDEDLARIIRNGIEGTAMPSFLLPQADVDALVEYVKYLSLRGEVESSLVLACQDLSEGEQLALTREKLVDEVLSDVAKKWADAPSQVIQPGPRAEESLADSIAKGRELFYSSAAGNCIKCHGDSGQGDGVVDDFDDWTKNLAKEEIELKRSLSDAREALARIKSDPQLSADERGKQLEEKQKELEELKDVPATLALLAEHRLPFRPIRPRNLRQGVYRGGHRAVDFYSRVWAGINGTPMPGLDQQVRGGAPPADAPVPAEGAPPPQKLSAEDIWRLVDFVRSLPYEEINRPAKRVAADHPIKAGL